MSIFKRFTECRHGDGLFDAEPVWKNASATNLDAYVSGHFRSLDIGREAETAHDFLYSLAVKTPDHTTRVENLGVGNQQKVILFEAA